MILHDTPEIGDGKLWLRAGLAKRFSVYQRLANALGRDWAVSRATSHERPSDDPLIPAESSGLSLVHHPSSLSFRLVPGFSFHAGFTADELTALEAPWSPEDRAHVAGLGLPGPSGGLVEVPAFLFGTRPVRIREVGGLIRGDGPTASAAERADTARVAFFRPSEAVAAFAAGPFRLPTAAEWESAYRAGAQSPFPWGDEIVESLSDVPLNALGLSELGVFPEGTQDGEFFAVRGGAILHAPWTVADGGWVGLLAGMQGPWRSEAIATARAVYPLPT